VDLTGSE